MDYKVVTRVNNLITALTDSKIRTLDDIKLRELKSLLKSSDELVSYAHDLLLDRLAANHSQTRKLALRICDVLFSRSRCFRRQLTAHFNQFVELTVGNKPDKPLPAPASVALDLRQKALEAIEQWHGQWGLQYPQVTLAYKYLKKHYNFPDLASRAAAAAAEEAARQQRRQHTLQQRYKVFSQEFPQQQQQFQSLLHQMQECFDLLQQPVEQVSQGAIEPALPALATGNSNNSSMNKELIESVTVAGESRHPPFECAGKALHVDLAAVSEAVSGEDQDWEDVPSVEQTVAVKPGSDAAKSTEEYDVDELVGDFQPDRVPDPDGNARQATVLEQLEDLVRQAHLATSKQLLIWLRLLSQLQVQNPQQQQQWQQDLKTVVELRAQLQAAVQIAAEWGVKQSNVAVPAADVSMQQQQPIIAAVAAQGVQPGGSSAAAPDSSNPADTPAVDLGDLPTRGPQPLDIQVTGTSRDGGAGRGTGSISFASSLRSLQEQQQHQQRVRDVYANIQDPTAAVRGVYIIPKDVWQRAEKGRWVQQQSDSDSEQKEAAAGQAVVGKDGNKQQHSMPLSSNVAAGEARVDSGASSGKAVKGLDPALRQKLMADAPKLGIAGDDWLLAQHGVMSHGMELYNHWGAVDSTAAIPQERLKELIGYTASFYKPSKKRRADGAAAADRHVPAAGHSRATAAGDLSNQQQTAATLGSDLAAATEGVVTSNRQQQVPDGRQTEAATGAADHEVQPSSAESLRKVRGSAHNRALLAGASGGEGLAIALQQQIQAESVQGRGRKGRTAKAPETKADKLRKKLFGMK